MIKVWILVISLTSAGVFNPVPPLADKASCEKVKASLSESYYLNKYSYCVEVNIPAPVTDTRILAPK